MKSTLQIGSTAEINITVTEDMCPAFDDIVVHRVYSTWSMAHHMEIAARKVLVPHLESHEEGIGGHLSIDHIAPTPVGHSVRLIATAIEVDTTTLECEIEAVHIHRDGSETVIGRGRQVQRVLPKTTLDVLIKRADR